MVNVERLFRGLVDKDAGALIACHDLGRKVDHTSYYSIFHPGITPNRAAKCFTSRDTHCRIERMFAENIVAPVRDRNGARRIVKVGVRMSPKNSDDNDSLVNG